MKELVENFITIESGICAPLGFKAAGVDANVNSSRSKRKDLAIIFSEKELTAAGVFTQNHVKAAPLIITQDVLKNGKIRAVVINSRNANACTGMQGLKDAKEMCAITAKALGLEEGKVAVASTGVIGEFLNMEKIRSGILAAANSLSKEGYHDAAQAIMTTDTFPKEIAIQFKLGESTITIGGISKGSGMVHPNLATILGFITTDARISIDALQAALQKGCEKSFNMISVDGDTSTNDMVLAMANGMADNPEIQLSSDGFHEFCNALDYVLIFLAKSIAMDGEGATKFLEIQVKGAQSEADARKAARAVSSSLLVKTAFFGCDANWGRILSALGNSGAAFDPNSVDLWIGDIQMMKKGLPLEFDKENAKKILGNNEVVVRVDLNEGNAHATAWGCDLSYEYVRINGCYRT